MHIMLKVLLGIIGMIMLILVVMMVLNRPLSEKQVKEQIQNRLQKTLGKTDALSSILFAVDSKDFKGSFAVGRRSLNTIDEATSDDLFHSASVGKTFTALVISQLVEEGKLKLETPISTILDAEHLNQLFVYEEKDYSSEVTIKHLLTHTSGAGDYFEDPVIQGATFMEMISKHPDQHFEPADLIQFTQNNQKTIGKPGEQFHYSDTGYVLLGMIIETIENEDLGLVLNRRIFEPANMKSSYLKFSQADQNKEILGIYINGTDMSKKEALSLDWAGGGIVTSLEDLIAFMKAFESNQLISSESKKMMLAFDQSYEKGIYYGMGMMYFDFSELSFMLGQLSDVYGGLGSTGTFIVYDEKHQAYYAMNLGAVGQGPKSIQLFVQLKMLVERLKK